MPIPGATLLQLASARDPRQKKVEPASVAEKALVSARLRRLLIVTLGRLRLPQRQIAGKWAPRRKVMARTVPVLIEVWIGLEINGYLPPEF